MKKILITILAAVALTSCNGDGYNAEKCDNLIVAVGEARHIQDVTKEQWRGLYSQFMSLDGSLRSHIMTLLTTPWSSTKEKAINDLLDSQEISHWRTLVKLLAPLNNSGFAPSAYFSSTEVADMQAAADATMLEMQNLLAQADLDGK